MKRLNLIIYGVIMILLVFVGISFADTAKDRHSQITKKLEFAQPLISTEDFEGYKNIDIKGLKKTSVPGSPELPFKLVKLLIPKGRSIKNVQIISEKKTKIKNVVIKPAAPIKSTLSRGDIQSVPDTKIYSSDTLFPGTYNSKPMIQWKSGYQILLVKVYPIQFNPVKKEIEYSTSMNLIVSLNEDSSNTKKVKPDERNIIKNFVNNPEAADSYVNQTSNYNNKALSSKLLTGNVDYVIITSGKFVNPFSQLITWKNTKGLSSSVVKVEDIYANYNGRDNQEKIRNFIIDAWQNNQTTYVLLGGDADGADVGGESGSNIVPVREMWVSDDMPLVASDLYYACLDGDFDYDQDGIYGEPTDGPSGGEVDLLSEVYVGRAPIDSIIEAENFVRKTIQYEKQPKVKTAWMIGEKLSDSEPFCIVEYVVNQQSLNAGDTIQVLKNLRDNYLNADIVDFYYGNDRYFKQAMVKDPSLVLKLAKLLVKNVPQLRLDDNSRNYIITSKDIIEINDFCNSLGKAIEELDIPSKNKGEIRSRIIECTNYFTKANGETFYNALMESPYVKKEVSPKTYGKLDGETWGGDYKDEIKNGSDYQMATAGFPSNFIVNTLYDRDYPENNWPKEEMINVLNSSPRLVNHMGHSNVTLVAKMENTDVDSLVNETPFFLYSQGCYPGSFDNKKAADDNFTNDYSDQDCIAEHMIGSERGAFALVVNSRYGWYRQNDTAAPSQFFDRQFWDAAFGEKITKLGIMAQDSKEDNIDYIGDSKYIRFCYYELNLLGDPTLNLVDENDLSNEVKWTVNTRTDIKNNASPVVSTDCSLEVIGKGFSKENVQVLKSGTIVPVSVAVSGEKFIITPDTPFDSGSDYKIVISNGVKVLEYPFETQTGDDKVAITWSNGFIIETDRQLTNVDSSVIEILDSQGNFVSGCDVNYDNQLKIVVTPKESLKINCLYILTAKNLTDTSGNRLEFQMTFLTENKDMNTSLKLHSRLKS